MIACWFLFTAWTDASVSIVAQDDDAAADREHQIKAAYLYQFGRYIEWPAKAFSNPQSPFVIGVLEQTPVAANLDQVARTKRLQNRPIQIRRFSSAADVPACHILFLPASLSPEAHAEIVRKMAGKNVLLVGESDGFLKRGGAVQFIMEENKIRVVIARKAAEKEGLTVSAKLLQVARIVD